MNQPFLSEFEDQANEDLGLGRITVAHLTSNTRPHLQFVALSSLRAVAPQSRLDVALAWWRNRNKTASVPLKVREKLGRQFPI
jgi:hypothetical protein